MHSYPRWASVLVAFTLVFGALLIGAQPPAALAAGPSVTPVEDTFIKVNNPDQANGDRNFIRIENEQPTAVDTKMYALVKFQIPAEYVGRRAIADASAFPDNQTYLDLTVDGTNASHNNPPVMLWAEEVNDNWDETSTHNSVGTSNPLGGAIMQHNPEGAPVYYGQSDEQEWHGAASQRMQFSYMHWYDDTVSFRVYADEAYGGANGSTVRFFAREGDTPPVLTLPPLSATEPIPMGEPSPTPTPTPDPSPTPTPDPTPTPTPDPTPTPTPDPTPEPTPTPTPEPTPDPGVDPRVDCSAYPEPRVFLEAQDWWDPIPELGGLGHIHAGLCFPLHQTVSGTLQFDMRVIVHENKGQIIRVKMQDDQSKEHHLEFPNITPPDGGTHVYWFPMTIDTTQMDDGMQLFRFYVDLEHSNGNRQTARPIFPAFVDNGGPYTSNANDKWVKPTGWYNVETPLRDFGYLWAAIASADYDPLTPVSGVWQPQVKCTVNATDTSPPVLRTIAHIDPNFHAVPEDTGTTILDVAGEFSGNLSIDTTQLSNGQHVLLVRCKQFDSQTGERHEGVGKFPFLVEN